MESEKERIEKATAEIFLNLYNKRFGTSYEIKALGEPPDVECIDHLSGKKLNLEVSLIEDLLYEIRYVLGRGAKPISPTTNSTVVSSDDSIMQIKKSLKKKLLASYGKNTALVLRQVSPLWGPSAWEYFKKKLQEEDFFKYKRHFDAGVWVICTDHSTWPARDCLFCLSEGK